jgi:hypothetical protein
LFRRNGETGGLFLCSQEIFPINPVKTLNLLGLLDFDLADRAQNIVVTTRNDAPQPRSLQLVQC